MKIAHYMFAISMPIVWGTPQEFEIEGSADEVFRCNRILSNCFEYNLIEIHKILIGEMPLIVGGKTDLHFFYTAPPTEDERVALARVISAQEALDECDYDSTEWAVLDNALVEAQCAYDPFRRNDMLYFASFIVGPKTKIKVIGFYTGKLPTTNPDKLPQVKSGESFIFNILLSGKAMRPDGGKS